MRTSSASIYYCSTALHSLTRCFVPIAVLLVALPFLVSSSGVDAAETTLQDLPTEEHDLRRRGLVFDYGPAPSPEDGPPLSAGALRNKAYLPAQIGGIVGAYALSLVVVAIVLISLAKRRRDHLEAGEEYEYYIEDEDGELILVPANCQLQDSTPYGLKSPGNPNYSYPTPLSPTLVGSNPGSYDPNNPAAQCYQIDGQLYYQDPTTQQFSSNNPYAAAASAAASLHGPSFDPSVDPNVVLADHAMAQAQLEQMYKYVLEQDEAKQAGIVLADPPTPISPESSGGNSPSKSFQSHRGLPPAVSSQPSSLLQKKPSTGTLLSRSSRKDNKSKPISLNLSLGDRNDMYADHHQQQQHQQNQPRTQSRTSSIFSALKSPLGRKKAPVQGMSISSPIMTPMSGTFPRGGPPSSFMGGGAAAGDMGEEMNAIPPRYYAPAAPPPVPVFVPPQTQMNYVNPSIRRSTVAPLTPPDMSPLSIDQRMEALPETSNNYTTSTKHRDPEEVSEEESTSRHHLDARDDRADEAGASSADEQMHTAVEQQQQQQQLGNESDASSQRTRRTERSVRTERSAARSDVTERRGRQMPEGSEAREVSERSADRQDRQARENSERSEDRQAKERRARPTPGRLHMPTNSQASRASAATYLSDGAGAEPQSAATQSSQAPLVVGLPTSPKPGARFSTLPASPRATVGFGGLSSPRGDTFGSLNSPGLASPRAGGFTLAPAGGLGRANAPSAVRTGGALPLRAYEPSITSPSFVSHQTKQTVFERTGPLSPGGAPWTGAPVPYTPYQPFSPVVPMTPSLVTKADRKRMRRLEPKTPTLEMVKSMDETW